MNERFEGYGGCESWRSTASKKQPTGDLEILRKRESLSTNIFNSMFSIKEM